jgi:PST family polysaccharide transporter/lipopolysaccharide exporter
LLWRGLQLVGAKLVFLARLLILARLLTPDDYGLLAIALAGLTFVVNATDLGIIPALVHRSSDDAASYDVGWTIGVIRAMAICVALWLAAPLIAEIFGEPRAIPLVQALATIPIIDAAASIRVVDLIRRLHFRLIAALELTKAVVNATIAIALANSLGVWAMVAGAIAGSIAYTITSYLVAPYGPRFSLDRAMLQPLLRFGRWVLLTAVVATVGILILRAIISRGLGTAELGLYFFAASIASVPVSVASGVVGGVAFPLYTQVRFDQKQMARTFRVVMVAMMLIVLPAVILLIVLTPSLVADIVGTRWSDSVLLIQILALASVIGLIGEALVPLYMATGRPNRVTALEVVQTFGCILLALWLITWLGIVGVAAAFLLAVVLSQILNALFIRQLSIPWPAGFHWLVIAIGVPSLIGGIVAWWIDQLIAGIPGLVLAILLGLMITVAGLVILERQLRLGLWRDLLTAYPNLAFLERRIG